MRQIYSFSQGFEEFFSANQQFEHLIHRLRSQETSRMEHGEIEALVEQEGHELTRRLLQGYLDHRSSQKARNEALEGSDGQLRSQHRWECRRNIETFFGTVRMCRA